MLNVTKINLVQSTAYISHTVHLRNWFMTLAFKFLKPLISQIFFESMKLASWQCLLHIYGLHCKFFHLYSFSLSLSIIIVSIFSLFL